MRLSNARLQRVAALNELADGTHRTDSYGSRQLAVVMSGDYLRRGTAEFFGSSR